ncbi:MAG: universal stress protein [Paludibacter sp.]|jgi:nucleotide-binding universal stress UspA family protein|nr:universal stress protein [Paludibacter sp.]
MEDKLVTLAIRTYQRATMLKAVLEKNGIEVIIHNLNIENPEVAVGVRVRIKESDLPKALTIVEEIEKAWEPAADKSTKRTQVLIALNFADLIEGTIDAGFAIAKLLDAEVVILHVYFMPSYTFAEHHSVKTYSVKHNELLRRTINLTKADAENTENMIKKRIANHEIADIPFSFVLKEGVPEDQIIDYCKKNKPALVVMGTHGKGVATELIGSVTAEVMESTSVPVFAVPAHSTEKISEIHRIAFVTNFDQKDLIAIDKTLEFFGSKKTDIYFIHAREKNEAWDEVMLGGIEAYFSKHYPNISAHYNFVGFGDNPDILSDFLSENKISLVAFNARRRNMFARLFNPGLSYSLVLHSNTMLFVTHI